MFAARCSSEDVVIERSRELLQRFGHGFTLTEQLAILAVLLIIGASTVPLRLTGNKHVRKNRVKKLSQGSNLRIVEAGIEHYYSVSNSVIQYYTNSATPNSAYLLVGYEGVGGTWCSYASRVGAAASVASSDLPSTVTT
jgi:hypothetical protein